jgi:uncharacterized protein
MLKVDLGLLARQHRMRIDAEIPGDDPMWDGTGITFEDGLDVGLEVQQAGADVVVRGHARGTAALACRRCTVSVTHELDEDLTFVYRSGIDAVEAEAEEVYVLPPRGQEVDLAPALLEHVQLAVPRYVVCNEACRGFCPRCGTDLNQASCDCVVEEEDPRWAALRRLRPE